jgi:hypothetical protein
MEAGTKLSFMRFNNEPFLNSGLYAAMRPETGAQSQVLGG